MAYKIGNRAQPTFLPNAIEDYVGLEDPVRVYDAFVDALDCKALGISTEPSPGADEYFPKDLLKLIVYGYSYGTRSSRKLERACYHNLSFQWLMGGQKPDYRTIARFRSKNKEQIKQVLKQCVSICIKLDLIEGNVLFVDGSKFRANASISRTWTKERCQKGLAKINETIDHLLEKSERIDKEEDNRETMVKLKQEIKDKKQLVKKIQGLMNELEQSGKTQMNLTDDDSVKAKARQGTHAYYNVQISTDKKHGLIVHGQATSQNNDLNLLKDQVAAASENLDKKPKICCADSGYSSICDIAEIDEEIQVVVPNTKQIEKERGNALGAFSIERFKYDEPRDEYICPEGKRLTRRGFSQDKQAYVYRCKPKHCRACQYFNVCTQSKRGRTIKRSIHEKLKIQLNENYQSRQGQEIYQLRKEKVEHPFGHIKQNLGAGQFMLRGRDKVDAEISVLSTCFNIARMITIVGGLELIARLTGS